MEKNSIELPTEKVPKQFSSPKNMVLYGAPKVGKTSALSQLENCLIIDLEDGSDYVEALKIKANSLSELAQIGKQIIDEDRPYKYVAIDTVTKLEEWCEREATVLYKKSPMGKNFTGSSVLSLPKGAGYLWLRLSFTKWLNNLKTLAPHVIFIGHLKHIMLEKDGKEVSSKDLDLTGKLKTITCSQADAIGYVFRGTRENEGKLMISFDTSEEVGCGVRCEHLAGEIFELDWKKIYLEENG